ncbi:trypsin-like serine protease [Streptomyces sp. NPDC002889]|uniref:trypsin-like serine protease n=1 Tax=Streptomyces sp. NPDC002889 TaxID=3364669 RepID=UPI0036B8341F
MAKLAAIWIGGSILAASATSAYAASGSPTPDATSPRPTAGAVQSDEAVQPPPLPKVTPSATSAVSPPATDASTPPPSASASSSAKPEDNTGNWTSEDAARFWTAERMASATPVQDKGEGQGEGEAVTQQTTPAQAPPKNSKTSKARQGRAAAAEEPFYEGVPSVGMLYFVGKDLATHSCTASVVHSTRGNLILTAGHCGLDSNRAFVPQYRTNKPASGQPHGIWAIDRVFKDPRHTDVGPGSDLDFAFATVKPDKLGRQVESVTGANRLTRSPGYANWVTVIGYPNSKDAPKDQAVKCKTKTTRLPGYQQMRMECGGFYGGTSGSPWIANFDENTKTGDVIGNLGGWNGGGLLNNSDRISFSPLYDDEVFKLYDDAVNNRTPQRPPLPYSPYSGGAGELWEHARLMASGDYTGDGKADTIVVWTDGEVTLYRGNGQGGYSGENQLLAKNDLWKHATVITGGDFTGSNTADLIVRWSDGEVSLYADVSATTKFSKETMLAAKDSVWKHATQVVAGRFSANKWTDDVLVRWKDGEVSLYTDVSATVKFSKEKQLRKPEALWEHATLLASGDFTGNDNWDVIIRWSDGERSLYPDVSDAGFGKEVQMEAPNPLWKHAEVMTAGNYNGNGHPDDLIVRWSDGELTLYGDTGTKLGTERNLVPPRTK